MKLWSSHFDRTKPTVRGWNVGNHCCCPWNRPTTIIIIIIIIISEFLFLLQKVVCL